MPTLLASLKASRAPRCCCCCYPASHHSFISPALPFWLRTCLYHGIIIRNVLVAHPVLIIWCCHPALPGSAFMHTQSSGGTMPNSSSPLPNPPRPLNNLRTIPHSGRDTLGVSWTARAGSASQQLDALLQTFSPKHAAMLSSGGLSSGGLQSTNSVPLLPTTTSLGGSLPDRPTPAVTSVAAAAVALQNSIFNVGSAPQSPSFRAHLQTFDATVGSPVQGVGKAQGIGSAGTSGASSGNGNQVSSWPLAAASPYTHGTAQCLPVHTGFLKQGFSLLLLFLFHPLPVAPGGCPFPSGPPDPECQQRPQRVRARPGPTLTQAQ